MTEEFDPLAFANLYDSQSRKLLAVRQARLAIGVWIVIALAVIMSFCFWRLAYSRPHALWGLMSVGLVAATTIALLISTADIVLRGPRRVTAIGWLMVGFTPLVWIGAFFTELNIKASTREPVVIDSAARMTATWACSILDLHARWKYPRWIHGEHVVLIDSGRTPDAERLVAEMDAHLTEMAQLLEQPMPDTEFAWVRGSLVGHTGRAILAWGLCGHDHDPDQLTDLDRHEMAHTLITQLAGPDQDPPSVLAEGWAESQSVDRDYLITHLADKRAAGRAYPVLELVGPKWYGAGHGPVYWEGGPLVHYLMEHYGPKKFFELYSGVRRRTFHEDCLRILGDSWDTVEQDFWEWLDGEAKSLREKFAKENVDLDLDTPSTQLSFAPGINPQDWHDLVAGYQAAHPDGEPVVPNDLAVLVELERVVTDEKAGLADQYFNFEMRGLFAGDRFWVTEDFSYNAEQILFVSDEQCACLRRGDAGELHGRLSALQESQEVRWDVIEVLRLFRMIDNPSDWLRSGSEWWSATPITIAELKRPTEGTDEPWVVCFQWQPRGEVAKHQYEMRLQPSLDWAVISSTRGAAGQSRTTAACKYQRIRGQIVPLSAVVETQSGNDSVVARTRWRELTAEESRNLLKQVEQVVQTGPTAPFQRLRQSLTAAVLAVPMGGMLSLAVAFLQRRGDK